MTPVPCFATRETIRWLAAVLRPGVCLVLITIAPASPATGPMRTVEGQPRLADAHATLVLSERACSTAPVKTIAAACNAKIPEGLSPSLAASFPAMDDDGTAAPPDAAGAAGLHHLMAMTRSGVRVQDRTGTVLSTMTLQSFWAPAGGPLDVFNPRLAYDPWRHRWIAAAAANARSSNSAVLVGVSATADPTGVWHLYKVDADPADLRWADFPILGFNKDWVVVSVNMFGLATAPMQVNIYAFNKTNLYDGGAGAYTLLRDTDGSGFALAPAMTADPALPVLYLVDDYDNLDAQLRVSRINGPLGAETLTLGCAYVQGPATWQYNFAADALPQAGTGRKIDAGDARILSCVYRNGSLWVAHTCFLPTANPTLCGAQWWQFTPEGVLIQSGRLLDPSGQVFYAYPTLAVNQRNDMMLGFSRFSPTNFAAAAYAMRLAADPPGTLRTEAPLKAGEGCYNRANGRPSNLWGAYSQTTVDPADDLSLWTLQEYAAAPVAPCETANSGRWGLWWGQLDLGQPIELASVLLTRELCAPTNAAVDPGERVVIAITLRNTGRTNVANLMATLLPLNGVVSPSAPVPCGTITAGGPDVTPEFSFTASGLCGDALRPTLELSSAGARLGMVDTTLQIGQPVHRLQQNFDTVPLPQLPAAWIVTNLASTRSGWRTTATRADSAPQSVFCPAYSNVTDLALLSPSITITAASARLSFRHRYAFETGYDGGVLDLAIGAGPFVDVLAAGGSFILGGYTQAIEPGTGSTIAGRPAWTGHSGAFISTVISLPPSAAGQAIRLRWRCASDSSTAAEGWHLDTIKIIDGYACQRCLAEPILATPVLNDGAFVLSYHSVVGQVYYLESSPNLHGQPWIILQTLAGTGGWLAHTNPSPLHSPARFYRVRTE